MKTHTRTHRYAVSCLLASALIMAGYAVTANAQTANGIPLCEISRSLTVGSQGEDVQCLQRYLNWSGFAVNASGPGSAGNETNYFGALTANAVARWQNANAAQVLTPLGIATSTGYWGPSSFSWYVRIVRAALGIL